MLVQIITFIALVALLTLAFKAAFYLLGLLIGVAITAVSLPFKGLAWLVTLPFRRRRERRLEEEFIAQYYIDHEEL